MIGDLSLTACCWVFLGFFYYNRVVITSFSCRGAGFIVVTSCCGLFFGDVHFSGVHSIPMIAASLVK